MFIYLVFDMGLPLLLINNFFYILLIFSLIGLIRGVVELYQLGSWANSSDKYSAYAEIVNRTSSSLVLLAGTILILTVV